MIDRRHGLAALACGALGLASALAYAYARSKTDAGTPVFWASGCAFIEPDSAGTPDLPLDTVLATLGKAIDNWQSVTVNGSPPCSYLKIQQDPPAPDEARLDRKNIVKFRTDKWCRPAESDRGQMCYSSGAAAITTVFYNSDPGKSDDGAIIDADIQLNNLDFTFVIEPSTQQPRPGTSDLADLENTLTHELGHFQGLDHTCWDHMHPYETVAPIDDMGKPLPDCNDITNNATNHMFTALEYFKVTQATMFNFAKPGETGKRTPKADDIHGICGIYPIDKDPSRCTRVPPAPKTGCAIGFTGRPPAAPALLLLLGLGLLRRSNRRR